jgi:hypothetical protein
MGTTIHMLMTRFPNLRMAYQSGRIYAGYAITQLNPKPYAYESAFSVQWLIADQFNSDPNLNYDVVKEPVQSAVLMWRPYLWANTIQPRQADGLVWLREDLRSSDDTHPSDSGRQKVAPRLLTFFKTDPDTQERFLLPAELRHRQVSDLYEPAHHSAEMNRRHHQDRPAAGGNSPAS